MLLAMSDDSSKGSPETEKRKEEGGEEREGSGEESKKSLTCELQPERQPQVELEDGDMEEAPTEEGGDQRREEKEVEKDPGTSAQAKREERMRRLRELHLRRVRVTRVQSMRDGTFSISVPFLTIHHRYVMYFSRSYTMNVTATVLARQRCLSL